RRSCFPGRRPSALGRTSSHLPPLRGRLQLIHLLFGQPLAATAIAGDAPLTAANIGASLHGTCARCGMKSVFRPGIGRGIRPARDAVLTSSPAPDRPPGTPDVGPRPAAVAGHRIKGIKRAVAKPQPVLYLPKAS